MIVVAHRAQDQSLGAIDMRCGIEIDVRDRGGRLILCHDVPGHLDEIDLGSWLTADFDEAGVRPLYAINVKSDGIGEEIKHYMATLVSGALSMSNYFCFDMSFPQIVQYKEMRVPYAVRYSDYETSICKIFTDRAKWIWYDWWDWSRTPVLIEEAYKLRGELSICAVSPELHIEGDNKKARQNIWFNWEREGVQAVCTDHWDEALEFWGET